MSPAWSLSWTAGEARSTWAGAGVSRRAPSTPPNAQTSAGASCGEASSPGSRPDRERVGRSAERARGGALAECLILDVRVRVRVRRRRTARVIDLGGVALDRDARIEQRELEDRHVQRQHLIETRGVGLHAPDAIQHLRLQVSPADAQRHDLAPRVACSGCTEAATSQFELNGLNASGSPTRSAPQ